MSKHPVYCKQGPITIYPNKSINIIQPKKQQSCVTYISNYRPLNEDHTIQIEELMN